MRNAARMNRNQNEVKADRFSAFENHDMFQLLRSVNVKSGDWGSCTLGASYPSLHAGAEEGDQEYCRAWKGFRQPTILVA